MKKAFFLSIILVWALLPLNAQERTTLGVQYQYALPMGGLKNDFIDKGSARGVSADLLYAVNPQWRVGAGFLYQDFYQKTARATYRMEDGSDLSAVVGNSLQTSALLAKGMFLPRGADSGRLQPYIAAGAGVNMVQYGQSYGEFSNGDDVSVKPMVHGGVGLLYSLGAKGRTALMVGAAYNYMPLNKMDIKNANNLAVQAGLRFALRNDGRGGRNNGDIWQQRQPNHYGGRGYGW